MCTFILEYAEPYVKGIKHFNDDFILLIVIHYMLLIQAHLFHPLLSFDRSDARTNLTRDQVTVDVGDYGCVLIKITTISHIEKTPIAINSITQHCGSLARIATELHQIADNQCLVLLGQLEKP